MLKCFDTFSAFWNINTFEHRLYAFPCLQLNLSFTSIAFSEPKGFINFSAPSENLRQTFTQIRLIDRTIPIWIQTLFWVRIVFIFQTIEKIYYFSKIPAWELQNRVFRRRDKRIWFGWLKNLWRKNKLCWSGRRGKINRPKVRTGEAARINSNRHNRQVLKNWSINIMRVIIRNKHLGRVIS